VAEPVGVAPTVQTHVGSPSSSPFVLPSPSLSFWHRATVHRWPLAAKSWYDTHTDELRHNTASGILGQCLRTLWQALLCNVFFIGLLVDKLLQDAHVLVFGFERFTSFFQNPHISFWLVCTSSLKSAYEYNTLIGIHVFVYSIQIIETISTANKNILFWTYIQTNSRQHKSLIPVG